MAGNDRRGFALAGLHQQLKGVEAEMALRFFRAVAGDAFFGENRRDLFTKTDGTRRIVGFVVLAERRNRGEAQGNYRQATHWTTERFQRSAELPSAFSIFPSRGTGYEAACHG